jgi:hypothetical protein
LQSRSRETKRSVCALHLSSVGQLFKSMVILSVKSQLGVVD